MDRNPPYFPQTVTLPTPANFPPSQASNLSVSSNVGNYNHVINFSSDNSIGLLDTVQRGLEGNTALCTKGESSKAVIPASTDRLSAPSV
jgi:hypothetical protein